MGEETKITWCQHTFNPWWGCEKVSAGCANCYAEAWAKRTGHDVFGKDKPRRFFGDKHWNEPLRWNAKAEKAGQRRRVFCGSMCDVFDGYDVQHLGGGLNLERLHLFDTIDKTPMLDWLLLTKRPKNIAGMIPARWAAGWPANVWIGITVENQEALNRTDWLLRCPATVLFLSCEPLLQRLRFANFDGIDWLIIGCEKLPGGRPGRRCELEWVYDLVAQGRELGMKVFVKQLEIDGRVTVDPADWPEDLRIQEFPENSG